MKCYLMNKNNVVMIINYNTSYNAIDDIYEINNIDYAPLSIYNAYNSKSENLIKVTSNWFKGRGIPSWRKDLKKLLEKLNVNSSDELLNKSYGLSLSDQYWLKEIDSNIEWKDINFFNNDFEYEAYLLASLDSTSHKSINPNVLKSPNNTTDGMLQKGWIIEDGKRKLVKGTYTFSMEEPFNEWLASNICKRLGFDYCDYIIEFDKELKLISKCDCFINDKEELISAYDVFKTKRKPNGINDYEFYISVLEEHCIKDARTNLENMFILDYLIVNNDRHMKNFGIIRDVKSLKWLKVTPIFDSGESMECDKYLDEMNFNRCYGKFFSNPHKEYDDILKTIKVDFNRIDINKLDGLTNEYKDLLCMYQDKLDISDKRITKLIDGLDTRINKLKWHIENEKVK